MGKKAILWASIIGLVSAIIIFFKFNGIPAGLAFDELEFARIALLLRDSPYIPYTPHATGHATLYFYSILGFFNTIGVTPLALRLPSAISGVLASILVYLIFVEFLPKKQLKLRIPVINKKLAIQQALLLALVFVSLRWYFSFARFAFEATFVLMLELGSLYAVIKFANTKKTLLLIISGIFAGFAYNSYQPGRLFVVLPLFFFLLDPKIRSIKNILIYLASFGIMITPLTVYFSQNTDTRIIQQLYLMNPDLSIWEKIVFFVDNVFKNTKMLVLSGFGDINGRHNYPLKPALNPVIFGFMTLGIIQSLRNWKNRANQLFLAYFLIAFTPTLLTYPHENPNMLRTFTVLPALVFMVGRGIDFVMAYVSPKKAIAGLVGFAIVVSLATSSVYEIRTYFVFQKLVYEQSFPIIDGFVSIYDHDDPFYIPGKNEPSPK